MKPAWDELAKAFEGNPGVLVGDVDCTAAGKPLCDANGVKGFPTIKWGDPSKELSTYEGGRDGDALKAFAAGLKPLCSPANVELCPDAVKARIAAISALPAAKLAADVEKWEAFQREAEEGFAAKVAGLEAQYEAQAQARDDVLDAALAAGLKTMRAVLGQKKVAAK